MMAILTLCACSAPVPVYEGDEVESEELYPDRDPLTREGLFSETEELPDPYETYIAAVEKTNALQDVQCSASISQDISLITDGQTSSAEKNETAMAYRVHELGTDEMLCEYHMTSDSTVGGQKTSTVVDLFADKTDLYVRTTKDGSYRKISRDDASAQTFNGLLTDERYWRINPYGENALKDATIELHPSGRYIIDFAPSEEDAGALVDSMMELLDSVRQSGITIRSYRFTDIKVHVVVDEDRYLQEVAVTYTLEMDLFDEANDAAYTTKIAGSAKSYFSDPGQPVEIELPTV